MSGPLRGAKEETGPESPEGLLISALIDTGEFTPWKYGINEDMLSCYRKEFKFGVEYQDAEGVAPPLSLMRTKYPEWEYNEVGIDYASKQLHRAHNIRSLRSKTQEIIKTLKEDDLDSAYALFESVQRPTGARKTVPGIWEVDHHDEDDVKVSRIPVPYESLGRVTGGIGPGELWYIAGRPGIGKTHTLVDYVAVALRNGYNVRYASLEMSRKAILKRVRRRLASGDLKLLARLDSRESETVKKAVDELKERVKGNLHVVDPSYGRFTSGLVRDMMQEEDIDLVVVDHVGLMYTDDGRKAIDDWRAMASISNVLKEHCLATGVPALSAVQLNREAEHGTQAPKLNQLSQSDALGQDGDVVVTMRKLSPHCMLQSAEKVREGAPAKWFTRFDPDKARFDEVSKDEAMDIQSHDDDIAASIR